MLALYQPYQLTTVCEDYSQTVFHRSPQTMHTPPASSSIHRDPFHQRLDPELFFPGAQREEICQALILDLLTDKQLLHLSGDPGSGKSLICQIIMDRLPTNFMPVYLESPTGSYEDLLRHASLGLGAHPGHKPDDFSWPEEFNRQVLQRQIANGRVVLIIDQAEQLFAATLERLLHRNRHPHAEEPSFSVLLCGSNALDSLLAQLGGLAPENRPEASYSLPPLERDETEKYLRYRLHAAGIAWEEHDLLLDTKLINRIVKQAQGNIALTNTVAADLLAGRLQQYMTIDPLPPEVEPVSLPGQTEQPQPAAELSDHVKGLLAWEQHYAPLVIRAYEVLTQNRTLLATLLGIALFLLGLGLFFEMGHTPEVEQQQAQTREIKPGSQLQQNDTAIPLESEVIRRETEPQDRKAADQSAVALSQPDGRQLLQDRLTASTSLVAASYRGASTIQLLTIAAADAEEQVVRLLDTPLFSREGQQLYIVRKRTNPPVYFIFYGIFDTLEQARQARNNMSFELRAHHPYPLVITDALLLNEG